MLIDLHCHTTPRSQCSALTPADYVELASSRGLDGVCFTEHDRFWPEDELQELRQKTDLIVLSGVELTTDIGHVLAFGLAAGAANFAHAGSLAQAAREQAAVLFLAHPARDGLLRVDRTTVDIFESVEGVNGSDSRLQNLAASGLARGFRLPAIAGSDAHTAAEVARAATRFEDDIFDNGSLVAALRSGRYRAEYV